ncbi:hypothetical protein D3C78_1747770 [compost metagenome]
MVTSLSLSRSIVTLPSLPVIIVSPFVIAIPLNALNFFEPPPFFTSAFPDTAVIFPALSVSFAHTVTGSTSAAVKAIMINSLNAFILSPPTHKL